MLPHTAQLPVVSHAVHLLMQLCHGSSRAAPPHPMTFKVMLPTPSVQVKSFRFAYAVSTSLTHANSQSSKEQEQSTNLPRGPQLACQCLLLYSS